MGKLHIVIELTETGFSAYFKEIPVFTTGATIAATLRNLAEAKELYDKESKKPK